MARRFLYAGLTKQTRCRYVREVPMNMKLSNTLSILLDDPRLFRQHAYVNGKWTHGEGGREEAVFNPATGEAIGHIPWLEAEQIYAAVDAAETAFVHWRALRVDER